MMIDCMIKFSVSSASLRFRYFMGRLVSKAESFEYADNDLPIVVINSDAIILQLCMLNYLEGKSGESVLYGYIDKQK